MSADDENASQEACNMPADAAVGEALAAYRSGRLADGDGQGTEQATSYEEMAGLWQAAWRACDFSWEGLADAGWTRGESAHAAQKWKRWKAPIEFPGGGGLETTDGRAWRQASLQDYWRWSIGITQDPWPGRLLTDDELMALGLLRDTEAGRFHLLHCPDVRPSVTGEDYRTLADGQAPATATGAGEAQDEPLLARLLLSRLTIALQLAGADAADPRAKLAGSRAGGIDSVLRAFAEAGEANAILLDAAMSDLSGIKASGLRFLADTDFSDALLGDKARFYGARFGDGVQFSHASFGEDAWFANAHFAGRACFQGAVFADTVWFASAEFAGDPDFRTATFCADASFASADFAADAKFLQAFFGGTAGFSSVSFQGPAIFEGAAFKGMARFDSASFEVATWSSAVFIGNADFHNSHWNDGQHFGGAFEGTDIQGTADFSIIDFSAFAALDAAEPVGGLALHPPASRKEAKAMFARATKAAKREVAFARDAVQREADETGRAFRRRRREAEDWVWLQLAGGCRRASQALQAAGERKAAQDLHRFAIRARMRRPGAGIPERMATAFYGAFSGHGASARRSLASLAAATLVFAAVYWAMAVAVFDDVAGPRAAGSFEAGIREPLEALAFSVRNAFCPVNVLAVAEGAGEMRLGDRLLSETGRNVRIAVQGVAILQFLVSMGLAAVFGFALLSKFRRTVPGGTPSQQTAPRALPAEARAG